MINEPFRPSISDALYPAFYQKALQEIQYIGYKSNNATKISFGKQIDYSYFSWDDDIHGNGTYSMLLGPSASSIHILEAPVQMIQIRVRRTATIELKHSSTATSKNNPRKIA